MVLHTPTYTYVATEPNMSLQMAVKSLLINVIYQKKSKHKQIHTVEDATKSAETIMFI